MACNFELGIRDPAGASRIHLNTLGKTGVLQQAFFNAITGCAVAHLRLDDPNPHNHHPVSYTHLKVGSLIGAMAYGANKDTGLNLFAQALKLNMESALGMVEYAHAMLMLDGEKMISEATRLYQLAARAKPADAMERLDVEMAKAQLED